jgi:hypothetical protein
MKRPRKIIIILLILAVVICTGIFCLYKQYQSAKHNPDKVVKADEMRITRSISKFMDLPQNDTPEISTVIDATKLNNQKFFEKTKNGDKVLIYNNAGKAILYRPSTNKVIEFLSLLPGSTTTNNQTTSVAIYNGTKITGLTTQYETKLSQIANLSIVIKENASKNNYSKTIVVDLSGSHQDAAQQISKLLGAEISTEIPSGELKPQTDILIIAVK